MAKTSGSAQAAKADESARQGVLRAVQACDAKKAADVALLELEKGSGAFTDFFVICSGSNPRQIQAISDEVEQSLSNAGLHPTHVEGYNQAEWVLLDYVDFVVHVFSESARKFYDLERLWKSARRVSPADLTIPRRKTATKRVRSGTTSTRARSLESGAAHPRRRKSTGASSAGPGANAAAHPRKARNSRKHA